MNRRTFSKGLAFLPLALMVPLTIVGCNVFTDIENWTSVGLAAVSSILAILSANGIVLPPQVSAIIAVIKGLIADLSAAVKEYQSTTPPPVGALQKIETIFQDIVDNFGSFITGLGLSGGIFAAVASIVQVILSTIAGFMNQLPSTGARTKMLGAALKANGTTIPYVPKNRTMHQFRKDYDSNLHAATKIGVTVPKEAYLEHWYDHVY